MMWLTKTATFRVVAMITMFSFLLLATGCQSLRQRRESRERVCTEIRDSHQTWYDSQRDCWRYWEPADPNDYDGEGEWVCSPDQGGREITTERCYEPDWCRRNPGTCALTIILGILVVGAVIFAASYGSRSRQVSVSNLKGGDDERLRPMSGVAIQIIDQNGGIVADVESGDQGEIRLPPEIVQLLQVGATYRIEVPELDIQASFTYDPDRFPVSHQPTEPPPALPSFAY